jgi:hypothetical protein
MPHPTSPNEPGQPALPPVHEPIPQRIHEPVPQEPIHPPLPEEPQPPPRPEPASMHPGLSRHVRGASIDPSPLGLLGPLTPRR